MTSPARRFEFGLEFSESGEVLRDVGVQRVWNRSELDAARAAARIDGMQDAAADAARQQAAALKAMAGQLQLVLAHLTRLTSELRADAADLALTAARRIAGAAIEAYPAAELQGLTEACAQELRAAPRLKVTLPAAHETMLRPMLEAMLQDIGFAGALRVEASQALAPGGCALDWDQGVAKVDPGAMEARIAALVAQRLAAAPPPSVDLFATRGRAAPENET